MAFLSPTGLQALAGFESSGNPTAKNPSSSASGLYGILDSTWQEFAPKAGVDVSQYPTAASAPADVQTAVASVTPVSNWTCPGCDPKFSSALGDHPEWLTGGNGPIQFVPQPGSPANNVLGNVAGYVANITTKLPRAVTNGADAVGNSISAGIATIVQSAENWLGRGASIILAIVLIGIGLFALTRHNLPEISPIIPV